MNNSHQGGHMVSLGCTEKGKRKQQAGVAVSLLPSQEQCPFSYIALGAGSQSCSSPAQATGKYVHSGPLHLQVHGFWSTTALG